MENSSTWILALSLRKKKREAFRRKASTSINRIKMRALEGALSLTKGKYSKPCVFHVATSKFSWQEKNPHNPRQKTLFQGCKIPAIKWGKILYTQIREWKYKLNLNFKSFSDATQSLNKKKESKPQTNPSACKSEATFDLSLASWLNCSQASWGEKQKSRQPVLGWRGAKTLRKKGSMGDTGEKGGEGAWGKERCLVLLHRGAHQGCAGLAQGKGTQGLRGGLWKRRNKMENWSSGVGRQLLGSESLI